MRAQLAALGAEHVYAFAIGDVLHHFHLHLVPRFADTPQRLRGRGAFDARPEDALPSWRIVAAAEAVRRALAEGLRSPGA
jgi:diadenosine tetraphosphate (Ap4A) HIT family hydrolase